MLISIKHTTTYHYEKPVSYGLQRLRLTPKSGATQEVEDWSVSVDGGEIQLAYEDHLGNLVNLVNLEAGVTSVDVTAEGHVETGDRIGIVGLEPTPVPNWYYLQSTELTTAGPGVASVVDQVRSVSDPVEQVHALAGAIREAVEYRTGVSELSTTAEQTLASGVGVCQDHSHVFLAAARELGIASRYVSGYLLVDDLESPAAGHAWVEAFVVGLGWVGIDVSNRISTDDHYVRVAVGRDYREAAPVVGMRFGPGGESLKVHLDVTQAQQQQ